MTRLIQQRRYAVKGQYYLTKEQLEAFRLLADLGKKVNKYFHEINRGDLIMETGANFKQTIAGWLTIIKKNKPIILSHFKKSYSSSPAIRRGLFGSSSRNPNSSSSNKETTKQSYSHVRDVIEYFENDLEYVLGLHNHDIMLAFLSGGGKIYKDLVHSLDQYLTVFTYDIVRKNNEGKLNIQFDPTADDEKWSEMTGYDKPNLSTLEAADQWVIDFADKRPEKDRIRNSFQQVGAEVDKVIPENEQKDMEDELNSAMQKRGNVLSSILEVTTGEKPPEAVTDPEAYAEQVAEELSSDLKSIDGVGSSAWNKYLDLVRKTVLKNDDRVKFAWIIEYVKDGKKDSYIPDGIKLFEFPEIGWSKLINIIRSQADGKVGGKFADPQFAGRYIFGITKGGEVVIAPDELGKGIQEVLATVVKAITDIDVENFRELTPLGINADGLGSSKYKGLLKHLEESNDDNIDVSFALLFKDSNDSIEKEKTVVDIDSNDFSWKNILKDITPSKYKSDLEDRYPLITITVDKFIVNIETKHLPNAVGEMKAARKRSGSKSMSEMRKKALKYAYQMYRELLEE